MNINTFAVRDGRFDVVVLAGPRLASWPSAGVRALAALCAEMGLSVGVFGGESITVRGVIPFNGTGGLVITQDVQKRVHRIEARAIVKVSVAAELPDPFPGWRSPGLVPLSTAIRLKQESEVHWDPATVILGTGNQALRFASELLESGVPEVYCVETHARWGAKRYSGWEVEKRRFDMAGGKLIEATPVKLTPKAALLWELRLQDSAGIRILEVARVVSAGPFRDVPDLREHPVGSFLFEMTQTAPADRLDDVEGWVMEEERGKLLGCKIVRALVADLGERREQLDYLHRRARGRLKRYLKHREEPFTPAYQGKWVASLDARQMRQYRAVPQAEHRKRPVAALECFEDIPCNICMRACPEGAIEIGRVPRTKDTLLTESKCTGCGICVAACPSGAALLVHEREDRPTSTVTLSWRGSRPWKIGDQAIVTNRRGENLGSARVTALPEVPPAFAKSRLQLVQLEVPHHLVWEARGLKRARAAASEDEAYLQAVVRSSSAEHKVEILLNGEKRLVRKDISMTAALFEIGQSRPEDVLFCRDGSCGLCQIMVDGVKKLACETKTHRGMSVKLIEPTDPTQGDQSLCPCLGITTEQAIERVSQGQLQSPEAVLSVVPVGEGRCHGQLCLESFRRVLLNQGLDAAHWVDWRFPWSDWVLTHS